MHINRKYLFAVVSFIALAVVVYALWDTIGQKPAPAAQPSKIVDLKNGDSYALTASFVDKKIGSQTFRMLAYNGSIPGPLIRAPQGAEITVNFTNATDIDTTLHSHGIRLDNKFDGTPGLTQEPIKPGGTFTYKIKFPDVGIYWYHPHLREDYAQELGLYGNYLVASPNDKYWSPVNREVPLFLDDVLIEGGEISLSKQAADHLLMGRYGNTMLVNGDTDYKLNVKKGEVVRFYMTNSANARPFRFAIAGVKMKLVGGDSGAYERDEWSDGVVLSPSERAVIEAAFAEPGTFALQNKTPEKTYPLGNVVVSEDAVSTSYVAEFATLRTHDDTVTSIDPIRAYFAKEPDKRLTLTIVMGKGQMGMPGMGQGSDTMPGSSMMGGAMGSKSQDGIEWDDDNSAMNGMSGMGMMNWKIVDPDAGRTNMEIGWNFNVGEKVKIRIFNDPKSMHPMQHPIHFHGQRFLVLAENGKPSTDLVWKDTVLVPAGQTVDILLDVSNPGTWMAHCHIAEHLEAGMMFSYTVK